MRLLVLGANGQLGGDLMAAAAARGIDAVGAGRETLDIADPEALRGYLAATPFDALVNCAAALNTEAIEGDPAPALAINAHAPGIMAEAAAATGARMIQVSTDYVFGGDAARSAPLTEGDAPAPVNVYGASKLLGETLARLAGGDVTVFRVASTFGVRGASGKGGNFVETMIRMGRERGKLTVVADQVMSPTATAWAAGAILDFLERGGAAGVYHAVERRRGVLVRVREGDRGEGRRRRRGHALQGRRLAVEGAPAGVQRARQRQARRGDRADPGLGGGARRLSRRQGPCLRHVRDARTAAPGRQVGARAGAPAQSRYHPPRRHVRQGRVRDDA